MIRVFKKALGADIPAPFPRMTWDEAMSRYGVDKPDTRFGLELQDVTPSSATPASSCSPPPSW